MLVETASDARLRRLTGEERVFAAALAVIALYSASVPLRSSAGVVVDLLVGGGAVALAVRCSCSSSIAAE